MGARVFISYGREDQASARRLYDDLRAAGLDPWLDVVVMQPGERWKPTIRKAIRSADFFVLLLSVASTSRRGFINVEIREALDVVAEMPDDRPFFMPARLDDCEATQLEVSEFNRVDLFPDWDTSVRRLAEALTASHRPRGDAGTPGASARPKAAAFVQVTIGSGASIRGTIRAIGDVAPHAEVYALFGPSDLLVHFPEVALSTIGASIDSIRRLPDVRVVEWAVGARTTASDTSLDL